MFELETEVGKAFEKGDITVIPPEALHRISNFGAEGEFCPYCGAELPHRAKYCSQCGKPV